jgi:phospholipid/cholesterol/gamma-HCH transport system substrate-binding protein
MERRGLELGVGAFLIIGLVCLAYISLKLGDIHILASDRYDVHARFTNVSGLKDRAPVTMAGVTIGQVKSIRLEKGRAKVTFFIDGDVKLEKDVVASIKTSGIIGDKYVELIPGASDDYIQPDGIIRETRPPLDIEGLLGRFVFGGIDNPINGSKGEPQL